MFIVVNYTVLTTVIFISEIVFIIVFSITVLTAVIVDNWNCFIVVNYTVLTTVLVIIEIVFYIFIYFVLTVVIV